MVVKNGDKVKVEYTGSLNDGTVFDSSENHGQPLEFEVGVGQVIKGFDEALVGMKTGDEKQIKLEPSEAYGDHNSKMVQTVNTDQFPKGEDKPQAGMALMVGLPDGQQMPATITKVIDDLVTIDLNHPLAGEVLNFKIKLIDISS